MTESCEDFIGLLAAISGGVQAADEAVLDEWLPEEPPATTLFAALGDRIAGDFGSTGVDANHRMFSLIEQATECLSRIDDVQIGPGWRESRVETVRS